MKYLIFLIKCSNYFNFNIIIGLRFKKKLLDKMETNSIDAIIKT